MSKHEDDISQIKKYLAGELDARAMYELERRAQNDPFLQDALDGYENVSKPQDENLKGLLQRLKDRTVEKRSRIIPMRFIAIAAGVLLFLFARLFWLINHHPSVSQKQVTKVVIPQEKKTVDTLPMAAITKPDLAKLNLKPRYKTISGRTVTTITPAAEADGIVNNAIGNSDKVTETPPSVAELKNKKDSTPLNEMVVMGYATKKKADVTASVEEISMDTLNSKAIKGLVRDENGPLAGAHVSIKGTGFGAMTDSNGYFNIRAMPNNTVLNITYIGYISKQVKIRKQDSLIVSMQPDKLAYNIVAENALGVKRKAYGMSISNITVTGVVKDNTSPLPGATVKVKGTNIITQTDANGKFILPAVPPGATLAFVMIGYRTQEVSTTDKKKPLIITLQDEGNSLAEVAVAGYGIKKDEEYQSAHPQDGWGAFRKYIKENAQSPDDKIGVVKVSFIVNNDNSLSDFKVIKGISAQTDSAAVTLIKNGPAWFKNTDNKAETIRVRVKFEVKK